MAIDAYVEVRDNDCEVSVVVNDLYEIKIFRTKNDKKEYRFTFEDLVDDELYVNMTIKELVELLNDYANKKVYD